MMKLMRFVTTAAMIVVLCFGHRAAANATPLGDPILLSDLLQQGSTLDVGDKEFSEFTYAATGDMPTADVVNVIPIQDLDGNFGVRFQGGFLDLPGGSASDALITYKVTVTDPNFLISDAHLSGNPVIFGTGVVAGVTETFLPEEQNATMTIFDIGVENQLSDWVFFDEPHQSIHVQKNILLNGGDLGASTFSFIDQTFSQIPEPGTFMVIGVLSGAALLIRRRR